MTPEASSASLTHGAKNGVKRSDPFRSQSQGDPKAIRSFAIELSRLSDELKCEQVVLIDVRGRNQLSEYLVIASGTSDRQMRAVSDQLKAYGSKHGSPRWKRDRDSNGTWIAADFVDVVVHLFEPGQRAWYDLEGMWADAPRVDWRRNSPGKAVDQSGSTLETAPNKSRIEMIPVEEESTRQPRAKKSTSRKPRTKNSTSKPRTLKKSDRRKASTKGASPAKSTKKSIKKSSSRKTD